MKDRVTKQEGRLLERVQAGSSEDNVGSRPYRVLREIPNCKL